MRTGALILLAAVALGGLSGCGGDDGSDEPQGGSTAFPSPSPSSEPPTVLTSGKSVVELAGGHAYRSPDGFEPEVVVDVTADGWVSTHRSADAFDVSQPRTDADAALVVFAFLVPPEDTNDAALDAVADRAEKAGATVERTGDLTITVTGGDGPLVVSRDGGIALDAVATGYARISSDAGGAPLLSAWWVPDSAYEDQAEKLVGTLGVVTDAS